MKADMYHPRPIPYFTPACIVLAKGSTTTEPRRRMVESICRVYPDADVIEATDTPHNKVPLEHDGLLGLHSEGKRTLVLAEHRSAVRFSSESGNCCPNYWHFSPYGFCPYGCHYCYLAGTKGVQPSPTVKLFLNLEEILEEIGRVKLDRPTAFYLGKLQDGLALDPLCGYSRQIVPFFASQKHAYLTLLTKSADVCNLLDLDHRGHSILSWTVSPPEIAREYEPNTPPVEDRLEAMRQCSLAGYPIRAVVMPILPGYEYGDFLRRLVSEVPLSRITLGSICSYSGAVRLGPRRRHRSARDSMAPVR